HRAARDVRIELPSQRLGNVVLEEIEAAYFVRAVVRAVTSTDAAVVHHCVQSFLVVVRGVHRTNRLARRIIAVLTKHRHEAYLQLFSWTVVVAIDAQPRHFASVTARFLADYRDIIFGIACNDTSSASSAGGEIDCHSPTIN